MLTSKQRARLRALANPLDTILQVGKDGVGESLINSVHEALEKRELIKIRVLENSMLDVRPCAEEVAKATNSEVVQVIGSRFSLYRENKKLKDSINING